MPRVTLRPAPRLSKAARRQLCRGARVEMEHTRSRRAARLIAAQHLAESPRYYQALARMERRLRKNPADRALLKRLRLSVEGSDADRTWYARLGATTVGWVSLYRPSAVDPSLDTYDPGDDRYRVDMVEVLPAYRRRGVASWLYAQIRRRLGYLPRTGTYRTADGKAFRRSMKNPPLGNTGWEFKQAAARRLLIRAVEMEGGNVEVIDSLLERAFRFAKGNWERHHNRILPIKDYPALLHTTTLELARLVASGEARP